MTSIEEPQCYTRSCAHLELAPQGGIKCKAFPKGIPNRIAYGGDKHETVAPDQVGNATYLRNTRLDV